MTNILTKLNSQFLHGAFSLEYPSFSITTAPSVESIKVFEIAARTCYRSEDKISSDISSGEDLMNKIFRLNHMAMIEFFPDMVVKFRTNRGVTHELVRQRICSFAQESTRYVKYNNVPFILPAWASASHLFENPLVKRNQLFIRSCLSSATIYKERIEAGCSPQEARGTLNNDTASYINIKANLREWFHIFGLRCDSAAHPDMRVLMCGLVSWLYHNHDLFNSIISTHFPTIKRNIDWLQKTFSVDRVENEHYIVPYVDSATDYDMGNAWADK